MMGQTFQAIAEQVRAMGFYVKNEGEFGVDTFVDAAQSRAFSADEIAAMQRIAANYGVRADAIRRGAWISFSKRRQR